MSISYEKLWKLMKLNKMKKSELAQAGAILIDATKLGEEYQEGNNKKVRLTEEEIDKIVDAFHGRKTIPQFSVVVPYEKMVSKKSSLAPGQYFDVSVDIEIPDEESFTQSLDEIQTSINDVYAKMKSVQDRINCISSDILYSKDGVEHVEKKCLSDIADLVNNSVSPMNNKNTLYKHYSIPAFDLDKCPALEYGSEIDSGKYLIPDGAILVSKLNPQFKRVWVPEKYDDVSICSTEFMPFVAKDRKQRGFLYSVVNGPAFQQYMIQCSSSSTGSRKRMQPELCGAFSFQCPTDSFILEKYNEMFESVLELERLAINLRKLTDRYQAFINPLINENVILFR